MSEALSRKKRVRGGHRGSVKRTITELYETIESTDEIASSITRLMQCKLTLEEKLVTVKLLDEQILELVADEEVDDEIEQADIFKEKVQRAIIDATATIEKRRTAVSTPVVSSSDSSGTVTSISGSDSSIAVSVTSGDSTTVTSVPSAVVSTSIVTSTAGTTPEDVSLESPATISAPSSAPVVSIVTPTVSLTYSTSRVAGSLPSELPLIPPHTVASTLVPLSPSVVATPAMSTLPHVSLPDTSLSPFAYHAPLGHVTKVKLPKLTLKRFNGDLTKWATFWDSFESSIHNHPGLSDVDKFNYLNTLIEGTAAEAVSGLKLTGSNYSEAVAILKRRFGTTKEIVSKHMEALVNIDAVTSQYNLKGLRHFYDSVESQVRGLKALGVLAESYGSLLSPIVMSKLPQEFRLIISRAVRDDRWQLDELMQLIDAEIKARERAASIASQGGNNNRPPRATGKGFPTSSTLVANDSPSPKCSYCRQGHPSTSCKTVIDPAERKQVLRRSGRCYVCLRRNHTSRDCRSTLKCSSCGGRHHVSICTAGMPRNSTIGSTTSATSQPTSQIQSLGPVSGIPTTTSLQCASSKVPVLLQTARLDVRNPDDPSVSMIVRLLFDSGSQRSYVTERLKESLSLTPHGSETMLINTFGSDKGSKQSCDVVTVSLALRGGGVLKLSFLSVPLICESLSNQPLSYVADCYQRLSELDLADYCCTSDPLEVDMLIGLDHYWKLVTGKVIHEDDGPIAIETRLGWVLSGPVPGLSCQTTCNLVSTHLLTVDSYMPDKSGPSLDDNLKKFWDLESLGVNQESPNVSTEFGRQISFKDGRYEVALPWKETHGALPSNYELSLKRLTGLLRRLRQSPDVFQQYDKVIREQCDKGIVETVNDMEAQNSLVHYLPHHPVVREDKSTTKLRIVYDASAKSSGSSLNDCLYAGPKFGQSIMDILLRFRTHRIALAADIEKAFLMVSVAPRDRDVLRFLWVDDIKKECPRVTTFRFTRVVFGVSSSPFLLNATIKHHVEKYRDSHPEFVNLIMRSIYVDDITYGASDEEAAFELYSKSKKVLAEGGFNLRKFVSNSQRLQSRIEASEGHGLVEGNLLNSSSIVEEDKTYTKDVLGRAQSNEGGEQKILGVRWNYVQDQLVFDLSELAVLVRNMEPTKRHIVGVGCKFYDPLGFISPITVQFKMLFQDLCLSKIDWDQPLAGELLRKWRSLVAGFHSVMVTIPRCYSWSLSKSSGKYSLFGFCDASSRAYAAVVYMRVETDVGSSVEFVASKTRVSPVERQTIPRLELLSALLLAHLMTSVLTALEHEITFSSTTCFTDSKVALYWIRGLKKEWKQFVQNRVVEIRRLVAADCWYHCPGRENPADIPSRGITPSELRSNTIWRHGPSWLVNLSCEPNLVEEEDLIMPEACAVELRAVQPKSSHILLSSSESADLACVVKLENFSKLNRLLRVTAYVLRFVKLCISRVRKNGTSLPKEITASEVMNAENLWVRESQRDLVKHKNFPTWRMQFGLFVDGQIWRCRGRLGNANISYDAKHPALLSKQHHFTDLVVRDAHERVGHNGVKETLTQIRAKFWIIRGRQYVRHILYQCVICRRLEGPPCPMPPAPSLPEFRVREAPAFTYTGVDFAGPLYVKNHEMTDGGKVWICLYTCCVTRAIHLELVPNLTAQTFIRSFKRFTARRGFPCKLVSDNGRTFKAAAKTIEKILNQAEVQQFTAGMGLEWCFNLEKAPWWGGVFERMIKSMKRCLRKTIGKARLTYEELMTALTEVEMIINSRPLSYVSSEEVEEPLTPSHLITGRRILSLPDSNFWHGVNDSDYNVQVTHDSLSRRMDHLNKVLNHFWKRWEAEYLLQLRECHRYSGNGKVNDKDSVLQEGQVVLMHNESSPRGFWKLVRIHELIKGGDGHVRGAVLRVPSKGTQPTLLRRPLKCLYPLEERCQTRETSVEGSDNSTVQSENPQSSAECIVDKNVSDKQSDTQSGEEMSFTQVQPNRVRPARRAAQKANSFIRAVMTEDTDSLIGSDEEQ